MFGLGVHSVNGLLYVIGGNLGPLPSIEVFDPRDGKWNDLLNWPTKLYRDGEYMSGVSY